MPDDLTNDYHLFGFDGDEYLHRDLASVVDPFAGSGTTAEACLIEGFRCVTIERCADYLPLIRARFDKPIQQALLG